MDCTSPRDFAYHLKHRIQEEYKMEVSMEFLEKEILATILGANRQATKGSIENMKEWRGRFFNMKGENDVLKEVLFSNGIDLHGE